MKGKGQSAIRIVEQQRLPVEIIKIADKDSMDDLGEMPQQANPRPYAGVSQIQHSSIAKCLTAVAKYVYIVGGAKLRFASTILVASIVLRNSINISCFDLSANLIKCVSFYIEFRDCMVVYTLHVEYSCLIDTMH